MRQILPFIEKSTKAQLGDTITTSEHGATTPLPGYRQVKPMVFAGLFPTDSEQFPDLKEALAASGVSLPDEASEHH